MKTSPISISLCIILVSISVTRFPSAAAHVRWSSTGAQEPAVVIDVDRNPIRAGVEYYILPVICGRGGGLTLAGAGNKTCPLSVVQEALEVDNGLPLTFSPVDNQNLVRESTDQNIEFSAVTICIQSTLWMLDRHDESTGKFFVTMGGVKGNPGQETISNWFKIEKFGNDYKLVYCPTVCDFCRVMCKDIGIFIQDKQRRLALTDDGDAPFAVVFKRA